ncbi:Hypothetical predicted protein, partial [Olea europaea subsp. europaea]
SPQTLALIFPIPFSSFDFESLSLRPIHKAAVGKALGTEENIISSRDKKAIGLSGVSREDYTSTELVDPDPAGFQE